MEIRKFKYKGIDREVIVTEESDIYLKGFDIGKLTEEEAKEAWRLKVKDIDMDKLSEEEKTAAYENLKELMKNFRHFLKEKIN